MARYSYDRTAAFSEDPLEYLATAVQLHRDADRALAKASKYSDPSFKPAVEHLLKESTKFARSLEHLVKKLERADRTAAGHRPRDLDELERAGAKVQKGLAALIGQIAEVDHAGDIVNRDDLDDVFKLVDQAQKAMDKANGKIERL